MRFLGKCFISLVTSPDGRHSVTHVGELRIGEPLCGESGHGYTGKTDPPPPPPPPPPRSSSPRRPSRPSPSFTVFSSPMIFFFPFPG